MRYPKEAPLFELIEQQGTSIPIGTIVEFCGFDIFESRDIWGDSSEACCGILNSPIVSITWMPVFKEEGFFNSPDRPRDGSPTCLKPLTKAARDVIEQYYELVDETRMGFHVTRDGKAVIRL